MTEHSYIMCHIQARHAEQRRQVATHLLGKLLMRMMREHDMFSMLFNSIYGPLVCRSGGNYNVCARVVFDVQFRAVDEDKISEALRH